MSQKNVALVLMRGSTVKSVILVRKDALEKDPEIIERLREEARELFWEAIVIEEFPRTVEAEDLTKWLHEMNLTMD